MAKSAAVLGVHLLDAVLGPTRIGALTRDADGAVAFTVSETYLRDQQRPILSLGWYDPTSDEGTRDRLAARAQKISVNGYLPPWFAGLLPEGALHELVLSEMGPGDHDQFDVLTRLGADLPGAVLITPETDVPASAGPLDLGTVRGFTAAQPVGIVKFSLAGIQLKFTANAEGERLTVPGRGESGHCIIKVPSERFPGLPEAEHGAMQLARAIGVDTAACRLVHREKVDGIPDELLAPGGQVLVVDRFDRGVDGTRIHIEDAAQVLGAVADRKYTMGTTETVINMVSRFSTDPRGDILEAARRVVAVVLLGNGDYHLKNWSFRFPAPSEVRLSKAYDIVPTVFFIPGDALALRFVRTQQFELVMLQSPPPIAAAHQFEEMLGKPDFQIFYHAPALILICAVGDDIWSYIDCTLAAQNLMLAAQGRGLGSCWIGFAQAWLETKEGRAALELPTTWRPVAPIIVGHPSGASVAPPRNIPELRWRD